MKQEAVSQSLLPSISDRITYSGWSSYTRESPHDLKASIFIFSRYRSCSLNVSTIKREKLIMQKIKAVHVRYKVHSWSRKPCQDCFFSTLLILSPDLIMNLSHTRSPNSFLNVLFIPFALLFTFFHSSSPIVTSYSASLISYLSRDSRGFLASTVLLKKGRMVTCISFPAIVPQH